jgi:hypothetical protein
MTGLQHLSTVEFQGFEGGTLIWAQGEFPDAWLALHAVI